MNEKIKPFKVVPKDNAPVRSAREMLEEILKEPLCETIVISYTKEGDMLIKSNGISRERFNFMLDQVKQMNMQT